MGGRFLSGEERPAAIRAAKQLGLSVAFDGGWEDAERVQPCFAPMGEEPFFSGLWLRVGWNAKFSQPRHRDLFGSLMALGIDRSWFGDLIMEEENAWLRVMPEMAERLPMEWTQAGRFPIRVELPAEEPVIRPPEGELLRDTVASTRLDSVLAAGMNLSRSAAAEEIRRGRVMVDHLPEERVDRMLQTGQLLSVTGFGRIRVKEVGSANRKDRFPIVLEVFSGRR